MPPKKPTLRTKKLVSSAKRKTVQPKLRPVEVTRTAKSIHIKYEDSRDVLPHLMKLVPEFTNDHLKSLVSDEDVLGTDAAKEIVSGCANSTCWTCTLGDLKLDSALFQGCVFGGVKARGYSISKNEIPATQDTQLYAVVMAIQGAKKG